MQGVRDAYLETDLLEKFLKEMAAEGAGVEEMKAFADELVDWAARSMQAVRDAALEGRWMPDVLAALNAVKPRGEYIELAPEQPSLEERVSEKFFGRGER